MTQTLFIVDLETTGLDPATSGIWEVGCVALRDRAIVGEFETLVWPGRGNLQRHHLEVIQQVSGILPGNALLMLIGAPGYPRARKDLLAWMSEQAKDDPRAVGIEAGIILSVCSYNLEFDWSFLSADPWYFGDWSRSAGYFWARPAECIMRRAAQRMWGGDRISLDKACARFGVERHGHRALADARAAAELWIKLTEGK